MMPDFVDQHVRHQMLQRLISPRDPFIEDGFAKQADAVGKRARNATLLLAHRQAFIHPGEFEGVHDPQRGQRLVVGEVFHPHHDILQVQRKGLRQPRQCGAGQSLYFV